jgi:hypothetical protein
MKRDYTIGQHIKFVDPHGIARDALVTIWWDGMSGYSSKNEPGCNLVYVSEDPQANDQYGRQLAGRQTSVVHKSAQPAHGNYWCWPDEI